MSPSGWSRQLSLTGWIARQPFGGLSPQVSNFQVCHKLILYSPGNVLPEPSAFQGTYASSASKNFRDSGMTVAFKTTFEVFTRVGPDNSLESLAERSVGLVTDQQSDVYELLVTPFE